MSLLPVLAHEKVALKLRPYSGQLSLKLEILPLHFQLQEFNLVFSLFEILRTSLPCLK